LCNKAQGEVIKAEIRKSIRLHRSFSFLEEGAEAELERLQREERIRQVQWWQPEDETQSIAAQLEN